jgi:iron complex outermembrane recepter protein
MNSRGLLVGLLILGALPLTSARSAQANSPNGANSPVQTVNKLLSQSPTVRVTGVKVNQTTAGVEVVLETAQTATLAPTATTEGNTAVSIVPNAVLALPDVKEYRVENPVAGITSIIVTQTEPNTIRVSVTGATAVPTVQVVAGSPTAPTTADNSAEPELEIQVIGKRKQGYAVPNASVGTKTDAPIRDVPQSIQVVPQQVLKDRGITNLQDALRNVSGVVSQGGSGDIFIIRGISTNSTGRQNILIDGVGNGDAETSRDLSNIEQVEVLKGPASVLYGRGEAGGTISLVTKQPLKNSFSRVEGTIGSFGSYRPTIDLNIPLNPSNTILSRLNVAYDNSGSFVDFVNRKDFSIAPVVSIELGKNTNLTIEGTNQTTSKVINGGLPAVGTVLPNPLGQVPRSRFLGEPSIDRGNQTLSSVGYRLDHRFSDNWSLRNRFKATFSSFTENSSFANLDEDNRTVLRTVDRNQEDVQKYTLQTEVKGKVTTGSIGHDLLIGVDLERETFDGRLATAGNISSIDLFTPTYGNVSPLNFETLFDSSGSTSNAIGIYAQDSISIGDKVKVLIGGRFDQIQNNSNDQLAGSSSTLTATAFSPRAGIVYQPIKPVSIYASYSRSFRPEFGLDRTGNLLKPVTGESFEAGVKTEFLDGKLTSTLAVYQITRQNDSVRDPANPDFDIQIGERRSQGIELDLAGEVLPGLRTILTYAYTDAQVTRDTTGLEGNRSINVPQHSANLSAVYEFQQGDFKGLGIGGSMLFVGSSPGDLSNTFDLPAYIRTDALLYYKRDNWKAQLNFENLFNVNYFGSSFDRNSVFSGAPFTVKAAIGVTF